MNLVERTEGNKIIAEFLQWGDNGTYHTPFENAGMCAGEPTSICHERNLKFHGDWNWLMLAVGKIESDILDGFVCVDIDGDNCHISFESWKIDVNGYTKIESVFYAVIEFIKWYKRTTPSL